MTDLSSAIQIVNDLVTRLDSLNEEAERFNVGSLVLRLDVLHRMLVNLDIDQEIVDTVRILHASASASATPLRDHGPLIYGGLNTISPLPRMNDVEHLTLRSQESNFCFS